MQHLNLLKLFSKTNLDKRKSEYNSGKTSNQNNATNSTTEKQKMQPISSSQKSVITGLQKPKPVARNINSVESRHFPGERIPPNKSIHTGNLKKRRSRSRSPLPMSKSSGSSNTNRSKMRIESERYVSLFLKKDTSCVAKTL